MKFQRLFWPGEEISKLFTDINMLTFAQLIRRLYISPFENVSIKQDTPINKHKLQFTHTFNLIQLWSKSFQIHNTDTKFISLWFHSRPIKQNNNGWCSIKRDITILFHLAQAVSLEFPHVTLSPHSDIARQVFLNLLKRKHHETSLFNWLPPPPLSWLILLLIRIRVSIRIRTRMFSFAGSQTWTN